MIQQVVIPGLPPTTNHLYPSGKDGRRHLSSEGREWQQTVCDACVGARLQAFDPLTRPRLSVVLEFVGMTYHRDIDGGVKVCLDALGIALGFDDRYIDELVVRRLRLGVGESQVQTVVSIMEMIRS